MPRRSCHCPKEIRINYNVVLKKGILASVIVSRESKTYCKAHSACVFTVSSNSLLYGYHKLANELKECRDVFIVIEARYAIWIIHVQCQLVTIDRIPDAGVVSSLAGPDSDITCSWQPIISCQFLVACARAHTKAITYGAV